MVKNSKCISIEARMGRILRGWDAYEGFKHFHPDSELTEEEYYDYVLKTPFEVGGGEHSAVLISDVKNSAGPYAVAEGAGNTAIGKYSHAEGHENIASSNCAHAEGFQNNASGNNSHVEGANNEALGDSSHVEGIRGKAVAPNSHAEGDGGVAEGEASHVEGISTQTKGRGSHAEGISTVAGGNSSHAEGNNSEAIGRSSHAEGCYTSAAGENSHAEGEYSEARGKGSHSEGNETFADGDYSHSEGEQNTASGRVSHVEGKNNLAAGNISHAEGYSTVASGLGSHAEGESSKAKGKASHAEGMSCESIGPYSHAGGLKSMAEKEAGFAHGVNVVAKNRGEAVFGRNNIPDETGMSLFQIGCGNESSPKTAFQVDSDGMVHLLINGERIKFQEWAKFVRYDAQPLSDAQQKQARENIGALGIEDAQAPLEVQVLRTGNIRIEGLPGGTKEFMPATPSGHPLHSSFVLAGGVWTPYDQLPDRLKDERSLKNGGYWAYRVVQGGLDDITTEEFFDAYMFNPILTSIQPIPGMQSNPGYLQTVSGVYQSIQPRFNICHANGNGTYSYTSCFQGDSSLYRNKMEVLWMANIKAANCSNISYMCRNQSALKRINCDYINIESCKTAASVSDAFLNCDLLEYLHLQNIGISINLGTLKSLANESILYAVVNVLPTATNVVLTLHPEPYARAMADPEIVAALETNTNITLASA